MSSFAQTDYGSDLILAGDLGGTKTLLALARADAPQTLIFERRYASRDYPEFAPLLAAFLDDAGNPELAAGALAVAGPVTRGRCKLTYLPWTLDAQDLASRYATRGWRLVNDFAAAAHGIAQLPESACAELQAGEPRSGSPRVVLGAGTGLGVAALLPLPVAVRGSELDDGQGASIEKKEVSVGEGAALPRLAPTDAGSTPAAGRVEMQSSPKRSASPAENAPTGRPVMDDWSVVAGEGGHMGYSPQTDQEHELARFLQQRHGRASVERVLSGPGLVDIYRFLSQTLHRCDEHVVDAPDVAAAIAQRGLVDSTAVSRQALDLFVTAYGRFAGDLALLFLPYGGVYLAGGMAPKILERLRGGPFLDAFHAKAEHAGLMPGFPLRVVLEERLALLGAATIAANLCRV